MSKIQYIVEVDSKDEQKLVEALAGIQTFTFADPDSEMTITRMSLDVMRDIAFAYMPYTETIDGINCLIKTKEHDLKIARRKIYKLNKRVKKMLKMANKIANTYPDLPIGDIFKWFSPTDQYNSTDPYLSISYDWRSDSYCIQHGFRGFTIKPGLFRTKISACLSTHECEELYRNFDAFEEFFYNEANRIVVNF